MKEVRPIERYQNSNYQPVKRLKYRLRATVEKELGFGKGEIYHYINNGYLPEPDTAIGDKIYYSPEQFAKVKEAVGRLFE